MYEDTSEVFLISYLIWEENDCYEFDWIIPCVIMSISRIYISGDFHTWIIFSTVIIVTSVLAILDVSLLSTIYTLWWHGPYILVVVIMTDILPSIHDCTCFHWITPCFQLLINIIHWLVIIVIRIFTLFFNLINALNYISCYNKTWWLVSYV